jgi:hypothetical protein
MGHRRSLRDGADGFRFRRHATIAGQRPGEGSWPRRLASHCATTSSIARELAACEQVRQGATTSSEERAPALEHDYQTQRISLAQGVAHNGAAGAGHGGDRVKAQRARAMALDLVGNDLASLG